MKFKIDPIIIAYLSLFLGLIFFDYHPFLIFQSFMIESAAIVSFFCFVTLWKGIPTIDESIQNVPLIIGGTALFLLFQYASTFWLLDSDENFHLFPLDSKKYLNIAVICFGVFWNKFGYFKKSKNLKSLKSSALLSVILLWCVTIVLIVFWSVFEIESQLLFGAIMISVRLIAQLYFNHYGVRIRKVKI